MILHIKIISLKNVVSPIHCQCLGLDLVSVIKSLQVKLEKFR